MEAESLTELSLFTGAGGGIYGTRLIGTRVIGYVECDEYRCRVIEQRIRDGIFDDAPIWQGDIGKFNRRCAHLYTGLVDLLSAGPPCRPFSTASHGVIKAKDLFYETLRTVAIVKPVYVLLENVAGSKRVLPMVRDALTRMGYCCPPHAVVAAASVGAPHIRLRRWILGYSNGHCKSNPPVHDEVEVMPTSKVSFWDDKPDFSGMDDGMAGRGNRLEAAGDGQVPAVVRAAWEILGGGF